MLQSLLLVSAFVSGAAQEGQLEIANPHVTYGFLGARVTNLSGRLPGDVSHFTFDLKNLQLDSLGRASYSMLVEVADAKGQPIFKLGPTNSIAQNYLGGNSMPCSAS